MMYIPVADGVHAIAKFPLLSLLTVPIVVVLPVELVAVTVTWTPALSHGNVDGSGCCSYWYAIHWLMYWSEIAGVPLAPGD